MINKIIISPHVDDEVLGCGGVIDDKTLVLHCGLAKLQNHGNSIFSKEARLKEFEKIKIETGCSSILLDNAVNQYCAADLISDIEKVLNEYKPRTVFIPTPSYNQDHKEVYKASIIALRPHDINYFVSRVLMYEQPQDLWAGVDDQFNPSFFVRIDIDRKLRLYSLLESQVRDHRSIDLLRNIAAIRGSQSCCEYAEAFQVIRWVAYSGDEI